MANEKKGITSKPTKDKEYILKERKIIIFERLQAGFTRADIARMLSVDKSVITKIINENVKERRTWILLNCK